MDSKKEGEKVLKTMVLPSPVLLSSEVDFGITGYLKYKLFGQELYITNTHIAIFTIMLVLIAFAIIVNINVKKADPTKPPTPFMNIVELLVETLDNLIIDGMGVKHGYAYVNYVSTLFLFLVVSNMSGLFGLRPPTADYGVTFALAIITFVLIHYAGFKYQKLAHITDLFKPAVLAPINIIGELATPLSMSLRLFGNVLSGTVLMGLIYGLVPKVLTMLGWPGILHAYFDVFSGAIQAYVFVMLTMTFISQNFDSE